MPNNLHDNSYGREMWEICWIRARSTRNLKLEPMSWTEALRISWPQFTVKLDFFGSELLESLKKKNNLSN
jgi:hypothetical protein